VVSIKLAVVVSRLNSRTINTLARIRRVKMDFIVFVKLAEMARTKTHNPDSGNLKFR
jgi:hypothetical protein